MPDFNVTSTTPDAVITKEIKQEVGRLYFDKIRNKAFNDYINDFSAPVINIILPPSFDQPAVIPCPQ